MPVLDPSALVDDRVAALRAYHASTGIERAELDVSGGIDSAVMAGLLTLALGPGQVTFVYSAIHSGGATRSRAQALIDALGGTLVVHDLTEVYDRMVADMLANLEVAGADMEACGSAWRATPACWVRSALHARALAMSTCGSWGRHPPWHQQRVRGPLAALLPEGW